MRNATFASGGLIHVCDPPPFSNFVMIERFQSKKLVIITLATAFANGYLLAALTIHRYYKVKKHQNNRFA